MAESFQDGANTLAWHPPEISYSQIAEGAWELYTTFGFLCPSYVCCVAEKRVEKHGEEWIKPLSHWPLHDGPDFSSVDISGVDVRSMGAEIALMALSREGSLLLQKILATDGSAYAKILDAFQWAFVYLATHPHANYVLSALVRNTGEGAGWIQAKVVQHFEELVTNPIGCRVISRLYENVHCNELGNLSELIMAAVGKLARHRFGRYSVQCLVHYEHYRLEIVALLSQNLPLYVQSRSSCRVIESVMEAGCSDDFVLSVRRTVANAPRYPTRFSEIKHRIEFTSSSVYTISVANLCLSEVSAEVAG